MVTRPLRDLAIEISPGETRAALVDPEAEAGALWEIMLERVCAPGQLGAIHLGRVSHVDRGMNGAFVDLGQDAAGFIGRGKGLTEGQKVLVQVSREALPGKGPGLTTRPVLHGRYLSIQPGGDGVTYSRLLGAGRSREALEPLIAAEKREDEAMLVHPAAAEVEGDVVLAELRLLRADWSALEAEAGDTRPPKRLRDAPGLVERLLRDRAGQGVETETVAFDDRRAFLAAQKLVAARMPDLAGRLIFHEETAALFDSIGISDEIDTVIERRAPVPGGGELVIETTEALTAVDVNMAAPGGRGNVDQAIFAANRRAAAEAARQIVLRNLAGLLVIDFISMRNKGHRKQLVDFMRLAMRAEATGNAVPTDVLGMSAAGLIEITRRRDAPPLGDFLTAPQAASARLSAETLACAALRAALRARGAGSPVLTAPPPVISVLEGALAPALAETGRRLGRDLVLRPGASAGTFEVSMERGAR